MSARICEFLGVSEVINNQGKIDQPRRQKEREMFNGVRNRSSLQYYAPYDHYIGVNSNCRNRSEIYTGLLVFSDPGAR